VHEQNNDTLSRHADYSFVVDYTYVLT
jgi:hypothetical protein